MATLQEKAKKRITKWKQQLRKAWWIEEVTGVDQVTISRIFNGRGIVGEEKCRKIVDAKEPKL